MGVNKYTIEKEDQKLDILEVDNTSVRQSQIKRLNTLKDQRDEVAVQEALKNITKACENESRQPIRISRRGSSPNKLLWEKFRMLVKLFLAVIRHKTILYQEYIKWK